MNLDDFLTATTFLSQKVESVAADQSRIGASFGLALAAVSELRLYKADTRRLRNLRSTGAR
jgi:hypothetical protein